MKWMNKSGFFGIMLIAGLGIASAFVSAQSFDWQPLLKRTLPEADKFNQLSGLSGYKSRAQTLQAFTAYQGEKQIGVIFYSAPTGYSGKIQTLVAFDMGGTIRKVNILAHTETPAYVGAVNDGTYQRQFEGISLTDKMVFLIGKRPAKRGEIQAMTGATETSKPIALAVSEARKLFVEIYGSK